MATTSASLEGDKSGQLRHYAERLCSSLEEVSAGRRDVDEIYHEYAQTRADAIALCRELSMSRSSWQAPTHSRNPSDTSHWSTKEGRQTVLETIPDCAENRRGVAEDKSKGLQAHQDPVRYWELCLEHMIICHRSSLTNTYEYNEHATTETLEALFVDNKARTEAVNVLMSTDAAKGLIKAQLDGPLFKWEAQFQHYDQLVQDLAEVNRLLQRRQSDVRPKRVIQENIAPHGDAILEFSNSSMNWEPVLRFRVSSHILAEVSPLFARMFSQRSDASCITSTGLEDDLPPAPARFSYADGSRALLWRMPQLEVNKESALTILLHAAHMHNDQVPRNVSYEQLVAVAETAIRYRCTKPLELLVEHCWLPQWVHKASDDMPDGLMLISYAFNRPRLFTHTTKKIILNLVDEEQLHSKNWPLAVRDKIWAVRSAKMAQLYVACSETIEEYLRRPKAAIKIPTVSMAEPVVKMDTWRKKASFRVSKQPSIGSPLRPISRPTTQPPLSFSYDSQPRDGFSLTSDLSSAFVFSSKPRCPKGDHWCDAANLGWLLLVYNELRLFSAILGPSALTGLSLSNQTNAPSRSLAQVLDALRRMPGPPHPVHAVGGVCDPAPTFRASVDDIYNSVTGLALHEVDGWKHGSGPPRHHRQESDETLRLEQRLREPYLSSKDTELVFIVPEPAIVLQKLSAGCDSIPRHGTNEGAAIRAFNEERICNKILAALETFDDLNAVAMVNHRVYSIYKHNELTLTGNLVKTGRRRAMTQLLDTLRVPEPHDCGPGCALGRSRGSHDYESNPLFRLLSGAEWKPSECVEVSSTRAIHRASSNASDYDSSDDSDDDWNFANASSEIHDVPVSIATPATTIGGSMAGSPIPISSTRHQGGAGLQGEGKPPGYEQPEGTNFYNITEQEAYRIMWPPDSSTPSPTSALSQSLDITESMKLNRSPQDVQTLDDGVSNGLYTQEPDFKYSQDDDKWLALQGVMVVEGKSLVLLAETNGNNKQLREEYDRHVGLAL
ncbi:hypothetical protein B0H66DRAFT_71914 [Apodospora peruviana]|uniref:Uncharacterized protein n=1 Tax=Apodospora peruviana TaxID=516989 RepID=A0AAE0MFU4_9PEZI|nr:hypothetical protein B0H66DRAFT_71914 [Apodospora peruviana]